MVTQSIDTVLYDLSIPAISTLQQQLGGQSQLMQSLSIVFDPKYAFLIYSPIAYLLDKNVGKKLIMTTVIAEWLNQILKWLLHGERPYWYVHSSGHFDPKQTPVTQFPVTCELGPGHPSGHAMLTSAVWYVILSSLLQAYKNHYKNNCLLETNTSTTTINRSSNNNNNNHVAGHLTKPKPPSQLALNSMPNAAQEAKLPHLSLVRSFTWSLYVGLVLAVSVSRVFLGCHFPHQCLAGAALGLLLARWICSLDTKASHYVGASAFMLSTAFGTFGLMQAFGFDPAWTIQLAMKHCVKREYIHLDTAPFFSIMRYCGFALGCGIGLMYPLKRYTNVLVSLGSNSSPTTLATKDGATSDNDLIDFSDDTDVAAKDASTSRAMSWLSAKILMALIMARLLDNLGAFVSHSNLTVFYSAAFAAYTLFSYAFINL